MIDVIKELFGEVILKEELGKVYVLSKLEEKFSQCKRCALHTSRNSVVFGWGNPFARMMFVGEAPGREEDLRGKPFVGKAGKLLTDILRDVGIDRERDIYITNVIKCRPPNNRDPKDEEISACHPILRYQIRIISPSILVALGRFSGMLLSGMDNPLRFRGKLMRSIYNIPLIITYHPAAALRKPALESFIRMDIERAWNYLQSS